MLDLELRHRGERGRSGGSRDLVGYMREAFRRFGQSGPEARHPSLAELAGLAGELAGVDLEPLFRELVVGTEVMALDKHLAHAGLRIRHADGKMVAIEPSEADDEAQIAARTRFLEPVVATERRLPPFATVVEELVGAEAAPPREIPATLSGEGAADDPAALHRRGRELLEAGDVEQAVEVFERAARLDPALADHQVWLGNAYLKQTESAGFFKLLYSSSTGISSGATKTTAPSRQIAMGLPACLCRRRAARTALPMASRILG